MNKIKDKLFDWMANNHSIINLLIIIAAIHILLALLSGYISNSPVPFADEWDGNINFLKRIAESDFGVWFSQHNEHRIVITRFLFLINAWLFQGSNAPLVIVNYFLAFASFAVFLLFIKLS